MIKERRADTYHYEHYCYHKKSKYQGEEHVKLSQDIRMSPNEDSILSIRILQTSLKLIGLWKTNDKREMCLMKAVLLYIISTTLFTLFCTIVDLYHSLGNISDTATRLISVASVLLVTVKLIVFVTKRDNIWRLSDSVRDALLNNTYDTYDKSILDDCDRKCLLVAICFSILTPGAASKWIIIPMVENINRNETERELPIKMYFNIPFELTPYYEFTFTIQVLGTLTIVICVVCSNSYLVVINLHAVGRFKILQHKLKMTCNGDTGSDSNVKDQDICTYKAYSDFKNCLRMHNLLLLYVADIENLYSYILLSQVLISSMLICVTGFQLYLGVESILRWVMCTMYFIDSILELFLVSWTCNGIIVESLEIASAAYSTRWYSLPVNSETKSLRDGLIMIMIRARQPCYLTAGNFAVVSIESFSSAMTTAMSYFTLLRQLIEDEN